jgi:type IX secretion system PorP/SprF family membrane protein
MKNLHTILLIILVIFIVQAGFSQQIPNNNFYQKNPFAINPAAAGIQGNISAFLNYRDQWSGLKGAPETISFGLHGLVTESMGLGLNIEQSNIGVFKQFSVGMNYSYRIGIINNSQSLSFGLMFGFSQNKVNYDEVIIKDESDPALYASSLIDEALVRVGFGIHYNWKDLNVHLATPLLYGAQERKYLQTLFGLVSYDIYLPDDIWMIQPSVLYRYTANNINQFDMNLLAEWDKKIWFLAGYRTNKNIITGIGISIKNIGIGYTYEINRSELSRIAPGSHEIILFFESPYSVTKKRPLYRRSKRRNSWN